MLLKKFSRPIGLVLTVGVALWLLSGTGLESIIAQTQCSISFTLNPAIGTANPGGTTQFIIIGQSVNCPPLVFQPSFAPTPYFSMAFNPTVVFIPPNGQGASHAAVRVAPTTPAGTYPLRVLVKVLTAEGHPVGEKALIFTLRVVSGPGPGAPDIDVSPRSIDFGAVPIGSTAVRPLTIRNVGQGNLVVNSITIQGGAASPFHFGGRIFTEGFTLPPGQAATIQVFFTPRAMGLFEDAVVIRSNDPNEMTVTVPLSGRTPTLKAQITTNRGCLEKGQNPVYFVNDPIIVQFRIDGVEQALATIEDILANGQVRVIFRRLVPGNQTLQLPGKIEPPLGRETLRLTAQAGGLIARDECSFTVQAPLKITGFKFHDLNGNKSWERDREPGIAGWRIDLTGPESQTTMTDANGRFEFTIRTPGTYTVTEETRPGWQATTPTSVSVTVRHSPEETFAEILFGNQKLCTKLIGFKFHDLNGNGVWEGKPGTPFPAGNEPPIEGWLITLNGPEGVKTTKTDAQGRFEFVVCTPGVYTVSEETRQGWRATTTTSVNVTVRLFPGETEVHPEILFGNRPKEKSQIECQAIGRLDPAGTIGIYPQIIVEVSVQISPPHAAEYQLKITDPEGTSQTFRFKTDAQGRDKQKLEGGRGPFGDWTIEVSWAGDDDHEGATNTCKFSIRETCTITVQGKVDDGTRHQYPISKSKVWLFEIGDEKLPLEPLSRGGRALKAETSTNHTEERRFDGSEFGERGEARYQFQLKLPYFKLNCPPRVVIVSLLWYDEKDLMAVSSENEINGRFVPIYLAKCVVPKPKTEADKHCEEWDGGPEDYTKTVNFSYGNDPTTEDSAKVIGEPGSRASEEWERDGARPVDDGFMRDSAHFYFYGYKAMRYLQKVANDIGVTLKPVVITTFTREGTAASDGDVRFGRLISGSREIDADSRIWIEAGDSDHGRAYGGNKPDDSIWHELGHYWWFQIYGGARALAQGDRNHGGYLNSSTTDSLIEGFAEFTSMLIAEHYGDPRPFMYRWGGHNENLEVNKHVWGRPARIDPDGRLISVATDEELAIAGLLWDLHDPGGGREPTPRGSRGGSELSDVEDWISLTDVQIFEKFNQRKPNTLKEVWDAFFDIFRGRNSDNDRLTDIGELFIMHGAFNDVEDPPLVHQGNEQPGLSGHGRPARLFGWLGNAWGQQDLPPRPGREKVPIIPHANLRLHLVDTKGQELDVASATMHIEMRFDAPFSYYDYQDKRPLERLAFFVMPSIFYQVTAFLRVEVPDVGRSEPLVITNEAYWSLFRQAFEAGSDHLLEHTFIVGPGVAMERVVWDPNANEGRGDYVPAPPNEIIEIRKGEEKEVFFRVTALKHPEGADTDRVVFDRDKANRYLASNVPRPVNVSDLPAVVKFTVSVKQDAPDPPEGGIVVRFTFIAQRYNNKPEDGEVGEPARVIVQFRYLPKKD